MCATGAVLAGTVLAAVLLFGRFVLMVLGFFLAGSSLIVMGEQFFSGWQGVVLLAGALVLIVVGRPGNLRRKRLRA